MSSVSGSAPARSLDPSPAPSGESTPPPHPLTVAPFRNLWIGSTISLFGDQFYLVALPWLVLQLTGSSLILGTILMASAIPRTVFMLVGGALTDRVSPRRVLLTTSVARMILIGILGALVWFDRVQLWQIYLLTVAFGIANAFSIPAAGALVPTLVKPRAAPTRKLRPSGIDGHGADLRAGAGGIHHPRLGCAVGALLGRSELPRGHRGPVPDTRSPEDAAAGRRSPPAPHAGFHPGRAPRRLERPPSQGFDGRFCHDEHLRGRADRASVCPPWLASSSDPRRRSGFSFPASAAARSGGSSSAAW